MNLRSLFISILAYVTALPAMAQSVDPKSVAAIDAAQSDWAVAAMIAQDVGPVTSDVVMWLRLRDGDADFADYQDFLTRRADWPGLDDLRAEAEVMFDDGLSPEEVIAWFGDHGPQTGAGAIRLARAHLALEQTEAARDTLRDIWIDGRLTADEQTAMTAAFGEILAPFHPARVDALLWRSRSDEAERMVPLLSPDQQALTMARIGYNRRVGNLPTLMEAVPAALRQDPGLAYARYAWLARRGENTDAVKMLLDRSTSAAALGEPFRWSGWRRILARWEMREGRAEQAYVLASRHYLTDGASYADLEWLSGYLSLIYLGDPTQALGHFENALRASSSPISVGRMQYWIGRTHEVKGNADLAVDAYSLGAAHQTSFYGLLASEKVGRPLDPVLAGTQVDWDASPVFDKDIVQAALILLAAGERGAAFTFFAELGRTLDATELAQLGAYLTDIDEQRYTVLLGKAAVTRGIVIPAIYFPIHDLAAMDLPAAPALSLSIARRESEFNAGIGSPAGALGLMQIMPATAREVSGNLGLPYARGRLTNDWRYNATLGATYLAYLEEEFGPSPVMIAAGYNAGPSRPLRWMDDRGDPRLLEMDVVDWIEHIPFRETRNYVMRVTESIPVYEARLTGQTGPVRFTELLIGEKPLLRPRARPTPASEAAAYAVRPVPRP
ncbi:soluble lytic murein transglycosylase [Yoonia maricola]|uniref:Soluble lytic murein transglycosylase n=1 Tax=Yoonia maricola TaxID=420999 RepID=A0A2M8W6B6_9RHOB|nr:lytic transglycosylase domain-containing protein [Yoonia maricola]PJI86481.1 soluble lytic murein transglycosylase [Yoonia maricola]